MHSTVLFEALDRQSDVRHLLKRGGAKSRIYRIRAQAGESPRMVPIQETLGTESSSVLGRALRSPLLRRVG